MKLFSLRLTTLKSKLYAIVFSSFVVRVVAFFVLPSTPSALGPDEAEYGKLANWTALGKPATEFPLFGEGLYVSARSFILPAAFLNKVGFTQLNSVRLTASVYGLLIICLVVMIILKTASKYAKFAQFTEQNKLIFFGLFLIFTFIPSHFVWSILGLRESVTEFWVISVFSLLFLILQLNQKASALTTGGFLISIIMVFSARPQVGWVLGVTLLLILFYRIKDQVARILIPITVLGILLGYTSTVALTLDVSTSYIAREEVPDSTTLASPQISVVSPSKETPKPSKSGFDTSSPTSALEISASNLCKFDGENVTQNGVEYLCTLKIEKKRTLELKNPASVIINEVDAIPFRSEARKLVAASVIETQSCPFTIDSRLDSYACTAYRAPFTTFTFLFRPILGFDVTSSTSLFAAIENVFWLASAFFVIILFIRNRRLAFFGTLAPSLLFMSIYSVAAGAHEGNMGTAFRHKSMILWVVILLLASTEVATQQRKCEREGISGSSQE